MSKRNLFLGLVLIFGSSLYSASGVYNYRIESFPKKGQTCLTLQNQLGQQFKSGTGYEIYTAKTVRETTDACTVELSYVAPNALLLVSTTQNDGGGYQGSYPTLASCQSDLTSQSRIFESETGLKPFIAYCYGETFWSSHSFVLRIDGFGEPNLYPQLTLTGFSGLPVGKIYQLETEVVQKLKNKGVHVSQVAVTGPGSTQYLNNLIVRYYAKRSYSVWGESILQQGRPEDCLKSAKDLTNNFSNNGIETLLALCSWDSSLFQANLNIFRLEVVDDPNFKVEVAPDRYTTSQACETDRQKVLDFYKNTLGKNVFSALCSADTSSMVFPHPYLIKLFGPCTQTSSFECWK